MLRRWLAPGGWDGPRWTGEQVERFEKLMREHSRSLMKHGRWSKPVKGVPALVSSWDDGRSALCWYEARRGPEERELYERCRGIFGMDSLPEEHPGC